MYNKSYIFSRHKYFIYKHSNVAIDVIEIYIYLYNIKYNNILYNMYVYNIFVYTYNMIYNMFVYNNITVEQIHTVRKRN